MEALTFSDQKQRETVFAAGEPGGRLFIVIASQIKVARRTADGRENLLAIAGRSDMFGELALFDPGPRDHRHGSDRHSTRIAGVCGAAPVADRPA